MADQQYDDDHPEVIAAKAEARKKILEGRAKLSPTAQTIYAISDSITGLIESIGCLIIIAIIVIALFAPKILPMLFSK